MVLLGLLAAFFAWQAAEPLWLALGRGEPGTATVTQCEAGPGGPAYPCIRFEAASGAFQVADVTLRGAGDTLRGAGDTLPGAGAPDAQTAVPARMLAPERAHAYATSVAGLHLRWVAGLVLVLACGAGIAWATGAARLERSRTRAVLLSFAGPLLLTAGFLAAAF